MQKMVYGKGKWMSRALCAGIATFSPPHITFVLARVSLNHASYAGVAFFLR